MQFVLFKTFLRDKTWLIKQLDYINLFFETWLYSVH